MSYQDRDWEIVDYQEFQLEGSQFACRGPRPSSLEPDSYFVCVGAAQTYGCFCRMPYPALLGEELHLPSLNLGAAGAGPAFFLERPVLLDYINKARFAVVQVLSGRSESNRLLDSGGQEYLTRRADGARMGADAAYRELIATCTPAELAELVAETRENWVDNSCKLLEKIEVPKILFWLSRRRPAYREGYDRLDRLFGDFPQLVNAAMIKSIRRHCDRYVECVTQRGSPQPLISRFTGEPTSIDYGAARKDLATGRRATHNTYYPSPEMHEDAALALRGACRRLARGGSARGAWRKVLNLFH